MMSPRKCWYDLLKGQAKGCFKMSRTPVSQRTLKELFTRSVIGGPEHDGI